MNKNSLFFFLVRVLVFCIHIQTHQSCRYFVHSESYVLCLVLIKKVVSCYDKTYILMFKQSDHFVVYLVNVIEISGTYTHFDKNTSFITLPRVSYNSQYLVLLNTTDMCITGLDILEKYDNHIIQIMIFCIESLHCPYNQLRKKGYKYNFGAFIILYALS